MLSKPWNQRKPRYDFVIIGSGYGGAITAARLANSTPKPSVCVLERGKEWKIGEFPNSAQGYLDNLRDVDPLGLYELLNFRDISVLKGSGLGGTSLVNANVAVRPPAEVFELLGWPKTLTLAELTKYYDRAEAELNVMPHPRAAQLAKVQALERRAIQIGGHAEALNIAVNFKAGLNKQGVHQDACTDCGDCVTGCNVSAKNTLYMNYLPLAERGGAEIFTQTKVEWIEKKSNGSWRVHGRLQKSRHLHDHEDFDLEASNVIIAAGSINSTEILLRSHHLRGLSVSPALGTRFGGNGDFFGLSYNGDIPAQALGFGTPPTLPPLANRPGPSIVAMVRHNSGGPLLQRFAVEDLSFPSASVRAAQLAFPLAPREDTDAGDTAAEQARINKDTDLFGHDMYGGALNHTMLYLCMGFDDARGTFEFEKPFFEPDGRVQIRWDGAGQQEIFSRINQELRRHTRAQGGSFVANPLWSLPNVRHLITAHPLGGCPMSDDFVTGATDQFGRVYRKDGSVHDGLYVADGALLPSALSVNPFLTISAVAERIAEKIVLNLQGQAFPAPPVSVGFAGVSAVDIVERPEAELERIFQGAPSLAIETMMNTGTDPVIDPVTKVIRNDTAWKGFFPAHHLLNVMSAAIFTGFQKRFEKVGSKFTGLTSDTDGRIRARNSLEQLDLTEQKGDLEPGRYILLRYLDPPWQGFYDIFKVINNDLLIGRVYLGTFPNGQRLFTFPMTRVYGFNNMKVEDHRRLWEKTAVPTKEELHGVWRMAVISNANQAGGLAHLQFDLKPDGRLESRYQFFGLVEGLVMPSFAANHFQLTDFTGFHDEIRKIDRNLLIGKWVVELPPEARNLPPFGSLGIFHQEFVAGDNRPRFGFYYLLTRTGQTTIPTSPLLGPILDAQLPAGLGLEFDEEMDGWYFPGQPTPQAGRAGDLTIADRVPKNGRPASGVECRFKIRLSAADINEFIDGSEHEARASGSITFENFDGQGPITFPLDEGKSFFQYLRVNPATGEAEMVYHLEFDDRSQRRIVFEGRKYMQKDEAGGLRGLEELLEDYTTLFVHISASGAELGTGHLRFRTFENLAAFRSLTQFLTSFRVRGNDNDPILQLRGQMKFAAFTGQFVQREYDPAGNTTGNLRDDVRAEVVRGAADPDFFSTQTTESLQAILRQQPTLPLDRLVNTSAVRIDGAGRRIFRDLFWKGSFAKDSLPGGEERLRNAAALAAVAGRTGAAFTQGAFWKQFQPVPNGGLRGHVVNYDLKFLPGDAEVRQVDYPNDGRRYFAKGDKILLLTYKNDPYRIVYDTIKVIDENSAIGVMHLGQFPDGVEFATFVMSRYSYEFELMSMDDYRLLNADPGTRPPAPAELAGRWEGRMITQAHPTISLMSKPHPVSVSGTFAPDGASSLFKIAGIDALWTGGNIGDVRMVNPDTLIGRWDVGPKLGWLAAVQDCVEPNEGHFWVHFVLSRKT